MSTESTARGTFTITMAPADAALPGTGRFDFTKTWTGEIEGTGSGSMYSAGDPSTGTAGYVAQEVFEGTIAGRTGRVVLHQLGTMVTGEASQRYEIAPGSGAGELTGILGTVRLEIVDGRHRVALSYTLP